MECREQLQIDVLACCAATNRLVSNLTHPFGHLTLQRSGWLPARVIGIPPLAGDNGLQSLDAICGSRARAERGLVGHVRLLAACRRRRQASDESESNSRLLGIENIDVLWPASFFASPPSQPHNIAKMCGIFACYRYVPAMQCNACDCPSTAFSSKC